MSDYMIELWAKEWVQSLESHRLFRQFVTLSDLNYKLHVGIYGEEPTDE